MRMRLEDYIISMLLMVSIVRQLRGRQLTWFGLAWPIGLVVYAGIQYGRGITDTGNNLPLAIICATIGMLLGLTCGRLSRVYPENARTMVRSTGVAAVLWIAGVGTRVVFGLYAEHGGAATIIRFDVWAHVSGFATWTAALLFMSLLEVLGRSIQLIPRMLTGMSPGPSVRVARPCPPKPAGLSRPVSACSVRWARQARCAAKQIGLGEVVYRRDGRPYCTGEWTFVVHEGGYGDP